MGAHDGAILSAKRLVELGCSSALTDDDVAEATRLIRGILPHVSDCDGLSIMVERLPRESVQAILDTRDRSIAAAVALLDRPEQVRSRPAASAI